MMAADFTLQEGEGHFWICDGSERVVLFVRMPAGGYNCNAVFLRQDAEVAPLFPASYHSATAIGVQADLRWRWGRDWLPMERSLVEARGSTVVVDFVRRTASGRNEQRISVDVARIAPGPSGYRIRVRSRLLGETGAGRWIEFLNYLPADAGHSSPQHKRFRATVHETRPGEYERRPHSQLTVLERYYWPDAEGFRRAGVQEPSFTSVFDPAHRPLGSRAPFAVSHLFKPFAPDGVMLFTGEHVTPAVRVRSSSAPVMLETCDVWYDEHFGLTHGLLQVDGRYLYEAEYELFSLAELSAKRIESAAAEVPASAWVKENGFAPFFIDRVNRFDRAATWEFEGATGVFFAFEDPNQIVSWRRPSGPDEPGAIVLNTEDPCEPPSGQHYQALRYHLGVSPWAETFPLGFALHVDLGERFEFSARIRTQGGVRARVEVREAFWGRFHREHFDEPQLRTVATAEVSSEISETVTGSITAVIPGSLMMLFLVLEGAGQASFTDLLVRPVRALSPSGL